ncbi:SDR family oxidoreductase [Salibacterium aidingense]|uniref:SDR family oxidoreductase n=1 Tax=Salibacterium aidingense TaxID=384933 RepID=UPI0003FA92D5|nr:SDR family NAD(P)-dependent oxidoreductase [Salibacterium aidingense]
MSITDFTMDYFSLKGKNAVVTGGNTGLGQAFALALAKGGANVFIPSIIEEDGTTRALMEKENVQMAFMHADLTEPGVPAEIIERCVETFSSIDILVNSAGLNKIAAFEDFGREKWDPMIQVNLTAAFEMSYEAAKRMKQQQSGKIINICSMFSFRGGQGSPAYAATKHGLDGLTKAYCDELAPFNIQVNGIAPGYFATDLTLATRNDSEKNKQVLDHIPAGRWGEPQDLMGTTVFLAGAASDYVNGRVIAVDGGYLVR